MKGSISYRWETSIQIKNGLTLFFPIQGVFENRRFSGGSKGNPGKKRVKLIFFRNNNFQLSSSYILYNWLLLRLLQLKTRTCLNCTCNICKRFIVFTAYQKKKVSRTIPRNVVHLLSIQKELFNLSHSNVSFLWRCRVCRNGTLVWNGSKFFWKNPRRHLLVQSQQ